MGLLVISFFAFVSLGLPDGLLGVAWPGIRHDFGLPVDALGIILVCGTGGYMLSSFFKRYADASFGNRKIAESELRGHCQYLVCLRHYTALVDFRNVYRNRRIGRRRY